MSYVWGNMEHDQFPRTGVIYFHSQMEFLENKFCKLYQIDETHSVSSLSEHTHNYFQIWYVEKGEFLHTINRKQYKMFQGNLFVVPPFAIHRVQRVPQKKMQIIGLEFLPHFINDRFEQLPLNNDCFDFTFLEHFMVAEDEIIPKVDLNEKIELKKLLEEMLGEYKQKRPYFELVLKANLLKLLSMIIREYTNNSLNGIDEKEDKYRNVICDAIEYIHNHYQEEIRLDEICKMMTISRTYFCYFFKQFTNKTFNEYLIDLRVRKSIDLLLRSDLSVTEICYHVGFNDLTYFSRIFKKYKGVSPSQFKKHPSM